jgi:hypothetical protein
VKGDLLVITPSRERPRNIARLLDSIHETSGLKTHLHVAIDDDDPELAQYEYVFGKAGADGDVLEIGKRRGLAEWTNEIAVRRADEYPFLASFGDDHCPMTPVWDRSLISGIIRMGGVGLSYPWDGTREDIPEAVCLSSNIVKALGWFCLPELQHFYVDNVWADLGWGAGCIRHLRAISVDHIHPATGKASSDKTYSDSNKKIPADREAYFSWRRTRMADDIAKIRALQSV